jgi:hypothetical protein
MNQLSLHDRNNGLGMTYRQTMLNAMTKLAWKILAMPSAKHRNMHSTPVLVVKSVYRPDIWRLLLVDVYEATLAIDDSHVGRQPCNEVVFTCGCSVGAANGK